MESLAKQSQFLNILYLDFVDLQMISLAKRLPILAHLLVSYKGGLLFQRADTMVSEVMSGIEGSGGVRCGIIGEMGCSYPLTPDEEKSLRAAALAQQRTGTGDCKLVEGAAVCTNNHYMNRAVVILTMGATTVNFSFKL